MDTIFTLDDQPTEGRDVNMDELYETEQKRSLADLSLYNRILARVHTKIKNASRQRNSSKFCWFCIPETLIGIPRYDPGCCAAYLIDKLRANGFAVRYTHPNLLMIGWGHWVPSYVRKELRKRTGIEVNSLGSPVDNNARPGQTQENNIDALLSTVPPVESDPPPIDFRDTSEYTPSGNLVYNDKVLRDLHEGMPRPRPG